jgi:apolipoprotein N-acyltransferase
MLWVGAALSAGLLELAFPLAGPLPAWRVVFAWVGLVPLLCALLSRPCVEAPRPLHQGFWVAYLCGVLWYIGNCYWVRDTMMHYGDMPVLAPTLLLIAYSMVLGLYFGVFGLALSLLRRATGSTRLTLAFAPLLWVAVELAGSRITCVPWDQLGYSQVDNTLVNQLAPWTGVYGISFVLVAVNALIVGGLLLDRRLGRRIWGVSGAILLMVGAWGVTIPAAQPAATETAMLVQPNLDVAAANNWNGPEWDRHMDEFKRLAEDRCRNFIAGIPETGVPASTVPCPPSAPPPALVAWPESPAPYMEQDLRFQQSMAGLARSVHAPLVIGSLGNDLTSSDGLWHYYNSALVVGADGRHVGRYDKIHLVPFGEYIPFKDLLFFARKLTGRVSEFTRGSERKVFPLDGHHFGVFICYESVFADEVRHFAKNGADVLVNISDDGWYGDTSAPWQHLNMARMRAIENRRWILRDTNNGVTAVIDPYGQVRQSVPRHAVEVLAARFGYRSDITFYTSHGDLFAWLCTLIAAMLVIWAMRPAFLIDLQVRIKSR